MWTMMRASTLRQNIGSASTASLRAPPTPAHGANHRRDRSGLHRPLPPRTGRSHGHPGRAGGPLVLLNSDLAAIVTGTVLYTDQGFAGGPFSVSSIRRRCSPLTRRTERRARRGQRMTAPEPERSVALPSNVWPPRCAAGGRRRRNRRRPRIARRYHHRGRALTERLAAITNDSPYSGLTGARRLLGARRSDALNPIMVHAVRCDPTWNSGSRTARSPDARFTKRFIGPPGYAHGGISAMLGDQIVSERASHRGARSRSHSTCGTGGLSSMRSSRCGCLRTRR